MELCVLTGQLWYVRSVLALLLILQWISCLLLPAWPLYFCISSAVLLCSPWSLHALSGNLLLICLFLVLPSCPPLPNLFIFKSDCTFLFLPLIHLVPHLLFTICLGLSFANTALFVFHFFSQMFAPPRPPHFSSLFSPLSQQSLSSYHHCLCFLRCHTRIQWLSFQVFRRLLILLLCADMLAMSACVRWF